MNDAPTRKLLIDALAGELSGTLRLARAASVEDWRLDEPTRSYVVEPRVRMAHHFDFEPAVLIRDSQLGTLGIVELVLHDGTRALDRVRQLVDRATYVRHLLLRDPYRAGLPVLTVELVLVTTGAAETVTEIGTALRELLRTSASLQEIGISLLVHENDGGFRGRLRRAFPWLLGATETWLRSASASPPREESAARRGRLASVRLTNYRLAGERSLTLSRTRVHLVHGANGSGKSSLVEALELASCGSVARLREAGESDYVRVVRNRGTQEPAVIELTWGGAAQKRRFEVTAKGVDEPLDSRVPVSSFRLDQPLMLRLIGQAPHQRAREYLEAFFTEGRESLAAYAAATEERARLQPGVDQIVKSLQAAREALARVQDWIGGDATQTHERFPDLLNRWLERTALIDLAQRERSVGATLESARTANWHLAGEPAVGLLAAGGADLASIAQQEKRWTAEAVELQRKLASFRPGTRSEQERPGAPLSLRREECDALNYVCRWIFEDSVLAGTGAFGDKLAKVLAGEEDPSYGTIVIGHQGWAAPVLSELDKLLGACGTLATSSPPAPWPGKALPEAYALAAKQQEALLASSKELEQRFFDKLHADDNALIAAINELMALFTPARWGYEDVGLSSQRLHGGLAVGMNIGRGDQSARAELILNTAELNLFTVALFLCCAGRVENPLGMLLFDDPLQNMDELTSIALARGLAKLVRLWSRMERGEDVMILFHGFDDLERFQGELPAAIYRLPWLSPSAKPGPVTITADRSREIDAKVQRLADLFETQAPD